MFAEGFIISLANTLGIPLGAKMRKAEPDKATTDYVEQLPDLVKSVIAMTRDDVCVGETPLFYSAKKKRLGRELKVRCDNITKAFNKHVADIAQDLLTRGYSAYLYKVEDEDLKLFPYIEDINIFINFDGDVIVTDTDGHILENVLLFLCYEKSDLQKSSNFDVSNSLQVNPKGIQLRNAEKSIQDLDKTEQAINRLRAQTRYIRFATVEVGLNRGDDQQNIVDDVSDGLNANSADLQNTDSFDDQLPVFPTRKGIGKPEVSEYVPTADIGNLSDLDYNLSKVFLAMRFPKSYSDFNQNLSQTAVSMIRGDLRYAKIVKKCRSVIEKKINSLFDDVEVVKKAGIEWKLLAIPDSEDSDIITMLTTDNDFITELLSIFNESETRAEAVAKLDVVFTVYRQSTNLKLVEKLYQMCLAYLEVKFSDEVEGSGDVNSTNGPTSPMRGGDLELGPEIEEELNSEEVSEPEETPTEEPAEES